MKHWKTIVIVGLSLSISPLPNVWAQQAQSRPRRPRVGKYATVRVEIKGAVKTPGTYSLDVSKPITKGALFSIIMTAGLGNFYFTRPLEIRRGDITLKTDSLADICAHGSEGLEAPPTVMLEDGDVIVVPTRSWRGKATATASARKY